MWITSENTINFVSIRSSTFISIRAASIIFESNIVVIIHTPSSEIRLNALGVNHTSNDPTSNDELYIFYTYYTLCILYIWCVSQKHC